VGLRQADRHRRHRFPLQLIARRLLRASSPAPPSRLRLLWPSNNISLHKFVTNTASVACNNQLSSVALCLSWGSRKFPAHRDGPKFSLVGFSRRFSDLSTGPTPIPKGLTSCGSIQPVSRMTVRQTTSLFNTEHFSILFWSHVVRLLAPLMSGCLRPKVQ